MKVIILAGGKGTRLPISAKNIPKVLLKVGSKPILQHQIDWLEKYGLNDIRLSLGFRAKPILNYLKGKYKYVIEPQPLDTGGAIKFATRDLKEEFLVVNGDILTDLDLHHFIEDFKKSRFQNKIVLHQVSDPRDFGLVKINREYISEFQEKPSLESFKKEKTSYFVNAGIYILSPEIFKDISAAKFSIENDLFPKLAKEKKLGFFLHNGFWIDVGTEERLKMARKIYQNKN